MYRYEFEIKGLPKLVNAQSRAHWAVQYREATKWKQWVWAMCVGHRPEEPLRRANLFFTRCSSVQPDCDNLISSFKHVRDGLIESKVILNDAPDNVSTTYGWEKTDRGAAYIRVRIEEA